MPLALGLDAGGTYTDAVLFDTDTGELLASAKAQTTPPTYMDGIAGALASLPATDMNRATYVSISTTLATNAIVEERHAPAAIILIGYDDHEASRVSWTPRFRCAGRHDVRGVETEPFDEAGFRDALNEAIRSGVQGIAISGVLAARNPEHELRAGEIARDCGLPVILGHRCSDALNAIIRAETAALNAGLIPLVHQFVESVEKVLTLNGLDGIPCMMVTGDGTLITTDIARARPVETILSGPACSALGAARLADEAEALVVDIGGTTTDVTVLEGGVPRFSEKGVSVGKWRAGVRSCAVETRGLGGDSRIVVHPAFGVGPMRVVPISQAASGNSRVADSFRGILSSLERLGRVGGDWRITNPTDVFTRTEAPLPTDLSESEKRFIGALENQTLTRLDLGRAMGADYISLLPVDRLVHTGVIQLAGLTPTDLWHVTGEFAPWDADMASLAARVTAERLGCTVNHLVERVREQIARNLARQLVEGYFGEPVNGECKGLPGRIYKAAIGEEPAEGISLSLTFDAPVIGVGAPARLMLRDAAPRIGARLLVPEASGVANAVGAATGVVTAEMEALVRPEGTGGVLCYLPSERVTFDTRVAAIEYARANMPGQVVADLRARGASADLIELHVTHHGTQIADVPEPVWWETRVSARGSGPPSVNGSGNADTRVEITETWDPPLLRAVEEGVDNA
jgi:N-methylhydantoinase A/oxoprolinase/acetone carboxylase beta subunit